MVVRLTEDDLHPHVRARMAQRGITIQEIERAINEGWLADDAKTGTEGKTLVLPCGAEWEGKFHEEKELTVYYKSAIGCLVLLTVKARYGSGFPRKG